MTETTSVLDRLHGVRELAQHARDEFEAIRDVPGPIKEHDLLQDTPAARSALAYTKVKAPDLAVRRLAEDKLLTLPVTIGVATGPIILFFIFYLNGSPRWASLLLGPALGLALGFMAGGMLGSLIDVILHGGRSLRQRLHPGRARQQAQDVARRINALLEEQRRGSQQADKELMEAVARFNDQLTTEDSSLTLTVSEDYRLVIA